MALKGFWRACISKRNRELILPIKELVFPDPGLKVKFYGIFFCHLVAKTASISHYYIEEKF
jgi:hypothetical protein